MRITLNLSLPESLRDRYALAWAIPATVLGIIVLILLGRSSVHEYRNYQGIQRQLAEVQSRSEELTREEASIRNKFEDPASRQLLVQAKFVNALIDQKELSLTQVTARVAGLLPENAQLTGLGLTSPKKPGDDYVVRLGIDASSEDAVETFINDLEDSADFKDVSIINQGFQEDTPQGEQVSVVCTARYLPGAEEKLEAASQETKVGSQKSKGSGQTPATRNRKMNPKVAGQKVGANKKKARNDRQMPVAGSKK
jgi:hypothetical protein